MSNYLRNPAKKAPVPGVVAWFPPPQNSPDLPPELPELKRGFPDDGTLPFQPVELDNPASQILGDSGSSEALKRLIEHTDQIKQIDTLVLLKEALMLFKKGRWGEGGDCALKALHVDEKSGEAWHILAIAREKCGDLKTAITAYETALRLQPNNPVIANDLGRLSYRLGMLDLSEKFFRFFLDKCPGHGEALNNLASVLREKNDLDGAIEMLQEAIALNPADPQLWNAIGTVVNARGESETAAIFYAEAMKFDPDHVHALYNYGNAIAVMGNIEEGITYLKRALPLFSDPMNVYTCKLSLAFCYMAIGDLENGWKWYEGRSKDNTLEQIQYLVTKPRWKSGMEVAGKHIFVSAEQGLGDEIMFATILPDLLREIGPEGSLSIGVEHRLVPLFQKAFPDCLVVKHHTTKHNSLPVRLFPDITDWSGYDYYALMGDFLGRYRSTADSFPAANAFFKPDPERIAYWKAILNGLNDKPKVGVLWKSLISHSRRNRYYSPFEQWKDVLSIRDIQFVNLQYGDTTAEMAEAAEMGLNIWTPPGIDLKNDLDDLSALCVAMDCILGPANATSNIAGAAGATVWMVTQNHSWNCLGTDHFPWYPTTRVFFSPSMTEWGPVMTQMRNALIDEYVVGRK